MTFFVSFGLWVWTSGIYYRPLPTPGCAIRLPFVMFGATANDEGIHFLVMNQRAGQFPTVHFERGFTSYGDSYAVNMLDLVVAVLPAEYNGGDYTVSPHAALVLPYWLMILGSASVLVVYYRTTVMNDRHTNAPTQKTRDNRTLIRSGDGITMVMSNTSHRKHVDSKVNPDS